MRQVVVTGLGAITPLGLGQLHHRSHRTLLIETGVRQSWKGLLEGSCGIRSLQSKGSAYQNLNCRVAGLVPEGRKEDAAWCASDWLSRDVTDDSRLSPSYVQ